MRFHALWDDLCQTEPALGALPDGYRRFQDWAHASVQGGLVEQLKRSRLGSGLRMIPVGLSAPEAAEAEPDEPARDTEIPSGEGEAPRLSPLDQGIQWLVEELYRIADPPRWVQGSQISDALIQRGPEYDYRRWWTGNFGRLLEHIEEQGFITMRQQGRNRPKEIRLVVKQAAP